MKIRIEATLTLNVPDEEIRREITDEEIVKLFTEDLVDTYDGYMDVDIHSVVQNAE